MRKLSLLFLATLACFGLFSCNADNEKKLPEPAAAVKPAFDKQRAKSFLDSINTKFSEQIAAGDSVALAAHYWPDAELLLDNSEAIKGNEIPAAWGAAIRMGLKEMIFSTTGITGSEEFIIETGNYECKDAKKVMTEKGKYVVVWEKRNGEWKLYRDIGCTSLPAAK